jgi:hypothetical protein
VWTRTSARASHPTNGAESELAVAPAGGWGARGRGRTTRGIRRWWATGGNRWRRAERGSVATSGANWERGWGNALVPLPPGSGTNKKDAWLDSCCPGRRISGPNVRIKWVRMNMFQQRYLFGSSRHTDFFIRVRPAEAHRNDSVYRFGLFCVQISEKDQFESL